MTTEREQILALAIAHGAHQVDCAVAFSDSALAAFYHAAILQYKDSILAEVGEPVAWRAIVKCDYAEEGWDYRFATHPSTYHDCKQDKLYTADQVLAARKDLEQEVGRLKCVVEIKNRCLSSRSAQINKIAVERNELRQQLAESKSMLRAALDVADAHVLTIKQAEKQLAAAQDQIVGLQEWMPHVVVTGGREAEDRYLKALAQPADTSALESIVKQAGEVMRERCSSAFAYRSDETGPTIHALPGVTLEDLQK